MLTSRQLGGIPTVERLNRRRHKYKAKTQIELLATASWGRSPSNNATVSNSKSLSAFGEVCPPDTPDKEVSKVRKH